MKKKLLMCAIVLLASAFGVSAEETILTVRVKARDAKFVGTSMGGARVVVRDTETGLVLAEGFTSGATGNTKVIMVEPHARGAVLSDEATAKFTAVLDLSEPTFVTIEARGPYAQRQAMVTVTTQLWLLPGKDISGDGIILELPGFVIDVMTPQTHERLKLENGNAEVSITANMIMMCGCPVTSGGLWDADQYDVEARILRNGIFEKSVSLKITEKTSTYLGQFEVKSAGVYEVVVQAYHAATGNTGVDRATVIVSE